MRSVGVQLNLPIYSGGAALAGARQAAANAERASAEFDQRRDKLLLGAAQGLRCPGQQRGPDRRLAARGGLGQPAGARDRAKHQGRGAHQPRSAYRAGAADDGPARPGAGALQLSAGGAAPAGRGGCAQRRRRARDG
ncbi:TolC family protein [Massilia sp. B-10]|nr:TolC family protein [Massilia sp. B-10]